MYGFYCLFGCVTYCYYAGLCLLLWFDLWLFVCVFLRSLDVLWCLLHLILVLLVFVMFATV